MNNNEIKNFLSIILFFIVVSILLVIGIYAGNLAGNGIADDPEQWGQFGDYIGGILNPILTIFNLILVAYLTLKISNNEEERIKNHLYENVKPLGLFSFEMSINSLKIDIHNVGLGPLIMTDLKIYNENRNMTDFSELIGSLTLKYRPPYSVRKKTHTENIIRKDDYITILDISIEPNNEGLDYSSKLESLNRIKEEMVKYKIKLVYTDLYRKTSEIQEEDLNQLNFNVPN
ncbi:hypothetical protein [Chryseobacterium mucoviscidosis]|uniref:hypothetical protein n=1 Tax=Chryseobacterium mucoviscidosis TaxID=1945581 RepID=UPI0031DD7BC9